MKAKSKNQGLVSVFSLSASLLAAAALLAGIRIAHELMTGSSSPPPPFARLIVLHEHLPRIAVAILAGAALGLAGCVMQRVLRNSLAEPTTLGSAAGAQLALVITTLFAPALLADRGELIALVGALAGTALCLLISARTFMSPISLILGGLIVNLLCSSTAAVLTLFHWNYLTDVYLWSKGTLAQSDWSVVMYFMPRLAISASCLYLLVRPLAVLALEDDSVRSLGVSISLIRLTALAVAVLLSAFVVSAIGLVGFIALAAPAVARALGATRIRSQMTFAGLIGAGLLWLTDELVQWASVLGSAAIPTGTATAVLGAPLLIMLLRRTTPSASAARQDEVTTYRTRRTGTVGALLLIAIILALFISFCVSQNQHSWHIDTWQGFRDHLKWRWPRAITALAAGGALAASGAMLQRLTGNPMASPELLGTTSGASFGVILLLLTVSAPARPLQLLAGTLGALSVIVILLIIGSRSRFSPERMLLAGVVITTIFSALVSFLLAGGDPRLGRLLAWMSGSTYAATSTDAVIGILALMLGAALVPFQKRWLAILPLGSGVSCALGVGLQSSRLAILLTASTLSAAATLAIGPMSFVGLMAPHLVRMAGVRHPQRHIYLSAAAGGLIMIIADWLGRTMLFPDQIPAGLLATLIGIPYMLFLLLRR